MSGGVACESRRLDCRDESPLYLYLHAVCQHMPMRARGSTLYRSRGNNTGTSYVLSISVSRAVCAHTATRRDTDMGMAIGDTARAGRAALFCARVRVWRRARAARSPGRGDISHARGSLQTPETHALSSLNKYDSRCFRLKRLPTPRRGT